MLLHHTGLHNKFSICPSFSESFLPGICKESINSALDLLEQNQGGRKSIADSLLINLFTIFSGAFAISKAYEQQDEECQENCKSHFCNSLKQTLMTCLSDAQIFMFPTFVCK